MTEQESSKITPQALVAFTVLLLFLGTILVTVGICVLFGWAWGLTVLGALIIAYGLIIGFSV